MFHISFTSTVTQVYHRFVGTMAPSPIETGAIEASRDAETLGILESTTQDPSTIVPVPGFGFLPFWYYEQMEHLAREFNIDQMFMNDSASRDQSRCDIVQLLFNNSVMPVEYDDPSRMCPPMFDNASCFPATPPGVVVTIPCMSSYLGVPYNISGKNRKLQSN